MLVTIESLCEIQGRCARSEPLSTDQQSWLADALDRFLSNHCTNLNEAFGIVQGHGGVPWWREQAMRRRDAALREMAARHFPQFTPYAQAKQIAALAERYAGTAWRHDRGRDDMPARYSGTAQEYLWQAFKSGASMPLSERRLRSLLA